MILINNTRLKMAEVDLTLFNTDSKGELEKASKNLPKKVGRRPKQEEDKKTIKITTALTQKQKDDFIEALDGRSEAGTIRRLILKFIEEQKI